MNNNFSDEFFTLSAQATDIHNLTVDTCNMCGGSYAENLNGTVSYFSLDGKQFKLTINEI
jgi:hypothetical protein